MSPSSNCLDVYNQLRQLLELHMNDVIEYEIIPAPLDPHGNKAMIFHEGLSIAMSKKTLVSVFLEARTQFFDHRKALDSKCSILKGDNSSVKKAFPASQVMLIFDPEHLTAANFRKHILQSLAVESREDPSLVLDMVCQELTFVESLVTSPLHRHTKSPTLWHHRRWILTHLGHLIQSNAQSELSLVMKAGERHPKNYYAWSYARWIVAHPAYGRGSLYPTVIQVKEWCLRNPGDISGWSFLHFLLFLKAVGDAPVSTNVIQNLIQEICRFALRVHWFSEALWWFVGACLASSRLPEDFKTAMRLELVSHVKGSTQLSNLGRTRLHEVLG